MNAEIEEAFLRGRARSGGGNLITLAQAHMHADHLAAQPEDNSTYLIAAEELGYAYGIANRAIANNNFGVLEKLSHIKYEIIETLGIMHTKFSTTDSDEASDSGAALLKKSAIGFIQTGDVNRAAIAYTNAAVALLEKSTITAKELAHIKAYIDFGLRYKRLDSIDWAYSQAALGMYYERLPSVDIDEQIRNMQLSREASIRALELFDAHDVSPSILALVSISRVERELFSAKRRQRRSQAVLAHLDELPEPVRETASIIPDSTADNIESNPAVFGFDDVPQWLSPRREDAPDAEDTAMLMAARQRLIKPNQQFAGESDFRARLTCQFEAAEININLQSYSEAYAEFLKIVSMHGDDLKTEELIRRGLRTIGLAEHCGEVPPSNLLLQVADAFKRIGDKRDKKRLEIFLRRNPAKARFVACELCRHGLFDDAISLIEASRVLLHSDHLAESQNSQIFTSLGPTSTQWVYVTHSARGTYVILRPDDASSEATGTFVPELTGLNLSELQFSFAYESLGLTFSQEPGIGSRHLSDATKRALEVLAPLTRAIVESVSDSAGICLILGGLYATLPVSAALSVEKSASLPYIAVVPSRSRTAREHFAIDLSDETSLIALSVPAAPGMQTLANPPREVRAVQQFVEQIGVKSQVVNQAARLDFETAYEEANILHYSGHSFADPLEPLKGALILSDGTYSFANILSLPPTVNLLLTTMSSCQSGQISTGVLADELISLSSALLYRGCRFVISTLWPVLDSASYVFMSRFYWAISSWHRLDIRCLSTCLTSTQLWMRSSTTAEIAAFMQENGLEVPHFFKRLSDDATPFEPPRIWAAYYLAAKGL